jgi:tetratricopeptide (TPR) repeat protein
MTNGSKRDYMIKFNKYGVMNSKVAFFIAFLTLMFSGQVIAQDACTIAVSLFSEPAKIKNYDVALTHYEKVVTDCPKYSIAVYQYAVKMFEYYIESGDKSKITELENAYQMRLKYFPEKSKNGEILADIAQIRYDNGIGDKQDQFNAFDKAYKIDEPNFKSPKSIYTYFSLAMDLYLEGQKDIQEVFDLYDTITEKIEKEEGNYATRVNVLGNKQDVGQKLSSKELKQLEGYEKYLGYYGKIKGSVDTKLGSIADCENLIPLYEKNFEDKKEDINWLKSAAGRLNAKDCETPLFYQLVQQLHTLQPSAASAFYLGRLADRAANNTDAINYYNQAVELESNLNKSADYLFVIAENYRKRGIYSSARTNYLRVLEQKPAKGICYLRIAEMYSKSSDDCGNNVFEKRAINWKAAEMAEKAARVDATIASNARASADSYRQRAPSKADIFSDGMAGKTIPINCWIGGSVKVPNL